MNDGTMVDKFDFELFRNTPIILAVYDFFKTFHQILVKFPKTEKHSLGIEIEKSILLILKQLIHGSALGPAAKKDKLSEVSINLDILKILIRLSFDVKAIDLKSYIRLEEPLQKVGRMLGGWIRSLK